MSAKPKRAAAYIRMSTDEQENSPQRQRDQLLAFAERRGYVIIRWYADHGRRGWETDRPEFRRLIEDAERNEFDVIIADELSRLTRLDHRDYYTKFAFPLADAGVVVDTVADGLEDWDEEDLGKRFMGVHRQVKGFAESVSLGGRTAKGLFSRARQAKLFVGPRPFGMDYTYDDRRARTGYIPGPPDEVAVVRLAFERYAAGDSLADIAADLDRRGVRTKGGRPWNRNSLHGMLTNAVYAGDYVYGRVARGKHFKVTAASQQGHERRPKDRKRNRPAIQRNPEEDQFVIRDTHPPVIPRELFDRVQALLAENRTNTSPSRARGDHLLSGLLYCPGCGQVMYGTTRNLKERVPVYVCSSYMRSGTCLGYWVREDEALSTITAAIVGRLADPEELERLKAALVRQQTGRADDNQELAEQLRAKVARLTADIAQATARLARVPERLVDGVVAEIEKMETDRADAEHQLAQLRRPPASVTAVDALLERLNRLPQVIRAADPDLIHNWMKEAIERVELRFRVIQGRKYKKFVWESGCVRLRESPDLSGSGTGTGSRSCSGSGPTTQPCPEQRNSTGDPHCRHGTRCVAQRVSCTA